MHWWGDRTIGATTPFHNWGEDSMVAVGRWRSWGDDSSTPGESGRYPSIHREWDCCIKVVWLRTVGIFLVTGGDQLRRSGVPEVTVPKVLFPFPVPGQMRDPESVSHKMLAPLFILWAFIAHYARDNELHAAASWVVTIIATLGVLWGPGGPVPGPQDAQRRVAIIVTTSWGAHASHTNVSTDDIESLSLIIAHYRKSPLKNIDHVLTHLALPKDSPLGYISPHCCWSMTSNWTQGQMTQPPTFAVYVSLTLMWTGNRR